MENEGQAVEQEVEINKLVATRIEKLKALQAQDKDPYEITKFDVTAKTEEIINNFEEFDQKEVVIAGRLMSKRIMGKASFCHVQDAFGKLQSYVSTNDLGEESYKAFKTYDIGDIVGIKGFVFKTKTGDFLPDASCKNSTNDFLRRHYPHQVKGSKFVYFLSACLYKLPCV